MNPTTKDYHYYFRRLQKAQENRHAPLLKALKSTKTDEEFYQILEDLNADSSIARMARIGVHLNEAFVMIRLMLEDPAPDDSSKIYELLWIDRFSNSMGKGELMQAKRTRSEMVERLHWISSEEFGEDLDEWADWMAAFEATPPATGHR